MADTTFQIDVGVTGAAQVDQTASAVDDLGSALKAATSATTAASDAVKTAEAAYRQAEATADRAAKAAEKVGLAAAAQALKVQEAVDKYGVFSSQAEKASAKLDALTLRHEEAKARADQHKEALTSAAASLDSMAAAAGAAQANQDNLKAAIDAATTAARDQAQAVKAAAEAMRLEDAKIAATTADRLRVQINAANEEAKAIQKADAEIAAATANKIRVLMNAANQEALAANKSVDAAKGLQKVQQATAAGTGKVNEIAEGLGKLGGPLGSAGQKAFGFAEGFKKLGASLGSAGPYVAIAVAIAAITTAALAGTIAIATWAVQLADKNLSPALKDTIGLSKQSEKLQKNIQKTFGSLKIQPLLKGISTLVDLFDDSTASGKAMKALFEGLFQPIIDGVTAFIPKLKAAFIEAEILVLRAAIAIKPYGSAIAAVGIAMGALVLVVVGAAALMVLAIVATVVAFVAFGEAIQYGTTVAINFFQGKWAEVVNWLKSITLEDVGKAMITGLAGGIVTAAPKIVDAMKGAVDGAIKSAKAALGIASPSRVFEKQVGAQVPAGAARGIEKGTSEVDDALDAMVTPRGGGSSGASAPASGQGGSSSSAHSANISGNTFNFYGVDGAEDAKDSMLDGLTKLAIQLGRGVPAT